MSVARHATIAAVLAAVVGTGWWMFGGRDPLEVQILDVDGYTEDLKAWMGFRVTLGLSNRGRELLTIRRIHVEPDFDGFNEAYSVATYELTPPIAVNPGSSISYQAGTTLLNATQLQRQTHPLTLRVRIDQNGRETEYTFPAEFDNTEEPARRALRY